MDDPAIDDPVIIYPLTDRLKTNRLGELAVSKVVTRAIEKGI
jgi:hypothetical protein